MMRKISFICSFCFLLYFVLNGCVLDDSSQESSVSKTLDNIVVSSSIHREMIEQDEAEIQKITAEMTHSSVIGGWLGAQKRWTNDGLPKNTRQTAEGYWLGSTPDLDEIEELYARNIRLILTVSTVPQKELRLMKQKMDELGMTHVYVPFGSKFPHPNKFMPDVSNMSPGQTFIHCEHGGDRTGAVLAFILIKRHHWTLPEALYSVILPSDGDINALAHILKKHGYEVDLNELEERIGIYSAEKNDGFGGLKVREDGGNYYNLIQTFIKRAEQ